MTLHAPPIDVDGSACRICGCTGHDACVQGCWWVEDPFEVRELYKRLTPNQIVAYNLGRARRMHGWTQEIAAERLEPYLGERWSKASFSVAERSVDHPERIKQFTADDLIAFAAVFELPISFFFIPPPGVEEATAQGARESIPRDRLPELAGPPPRERSTCLALALALDAAQTAIRSAGHPLNAHQIATSIGAEPTAQLHQLLRELARRGHLRVRGVRIRWYGLPAADVEAGA